MKPAESKDSTKPLGATLSALRPGAYPLGSEKSRAAARAMLSARLATEDSAREVFRVFLPQLWQMVPDEFGHYHEPQLDLSTSSCRRMLCDNGMVMEVVRIHGNTDGLADKQLDEWVATFPIERAP